jgi:hypothetical protein
MVRVGGQFTLAVTERVNYRLLPIGRHCSGSPGQGRAAVQGAGIQQRAGGALRGACLGAWGRDRRDYGALPSAALSTLHQ